MLYTKAEKQDVQDSFDNVAIDVRNLMKAQCALFHAVSETFGKVTEDMRAIVERLDVLEAGKSRKVTKVKKAAKAKK